jgi:hypothetical protein
MLVDSTAIPVEIGSRGRWEAPLRAEAEEFTAAAFLSGNAVMGILFVKGLVSER